MSTKEIYERAYSSPDYRKVSRGLNFFRAHLDLFPNPNATVLDIGCGTGKLLKELIEFGYNAWGIDFAHNALDTNVAEEYQHRFIEQDIREPFKIKPQFGFDLGVCFDVLEHIEEQDMVVVLQNIILSCNHVLFTIANHRDGFGPKLGLGALHVTLKSWKWWKGRYSP